MKDDVSLSEHEPRIKNVYFGKRPSLAPEMQEPTRPLTKAERYEQAIEAGWQDWLESTARNNPKYVPEVEAEIAVLRQQRQRDIAEAEARARGEQADNPTPALPEGDLRTGQEGG